jgi:hypothetical protein
VLSAGAPPWHSSCHSTAQKIPVRPEWRFLEGEVLEFGECGYAPLQYRIPAVLGFLWLLTRAFIGTKTLRAPICLFFLEKLLQEAPFQSDPDFFSGGSAAGVGAQKAVYTSYPLEGAHTGPHTAGRDYSNCPGSLAANGPRQQKVAWVTGN